MTPIHVLLVGCGSMGKSHARVLTSFPQVQLVGIIDPASHQIPRGIPHFKSIPQFLKLHSIPPVVIIASPNPTHLAMVRFFAGKCSAILIEKPLALNSRQINAIYKCIRSTSTYIQVGHLERYNPAFELLLKKYREGFLGTIYRLEFTRIGPYPAMTEDTGVGLDLAIHDIDLSLTLTHQNPKWLFCRTEKKIHPHCEDGFNLLMEFRNGLLCQITANWLSPRKERILKVYGQNGLLQCDFIQQSLTYYEYKSTTTVTKKLKNQEDEVEKEGKKKIFALHFDEPLHRQYIDFFSQIEQFLGYKKKFPLALLQAGRSVNVVEKALLSAKLSRKIKF